MATRIAAEDMSPKIAAAVRVNGELREAPADWPPSALFPIYSVSKTVTAICLLRRFGRVSIAICVATSENPGTQDYERMVLRELFES